MNIVNINYPQIHRQFAYDMVPFLASMKIYYNYLKPISVRAVKGVGLRPLACWDCGFESPRGHGFLSLVIVVCCQRSLRQTDPSFRGVLRVSRV